MLDAEMMLLAELVPVFLLAFWEHQDDVQLWAVLVEALDGAHQDRLACYWQKLLGNLASHAEALASGYYDYIIHISFFLFFYLLSIRWVYIMPFCNSPVMPSPAK